MAQDLRQAGSGGGREGEREEGRECAARTPCCAQVRYCRGCASAPGSGGRRTRRGGMAWPLECRPLASKRDIDSHGTLGSVCVSVREWWWWWWCREALLPVLGAGVGRAPRRGPAPGWRCRSCRRRPAAPGERGSSAQKRIFFQPSLRPRCGS